MTVVAPKGRLNVIVVEPFLFAAGVRTIVQDFAAPTIEIPAAGMSAASLEVAVSEAWQLRAESMSSMFKEILLRTASSFTDCAATVVIVGASSTAATDSVKLRGVPGSSVSVGAIAISVVPDWLAKGVIVAVQSGQVPPMTTAPVAATSAVLDDVYEK